MIGAELKHRGEDLRAGAGTPAPIGSAVEGLPSGLLHPGYRHRAAHDRSRRRYSAGEVEVLLTLRRLSPPSRNISEFSTKRSIIAAAMVVL
jgi:hypothetical protein